MKNAFILLFAAFAASTLASCQKNNKYSGEFKLATEEDTICYVLGMYEATSLLETILRSPVDSVDEKALVNVFANSKPRAEYGDMCREQFDCFSAEAFNYGFNHALLEKPAIEMQTGINLLNQKVRDIRARRDSARAEEARANLGINKQFLEENAKKEGITVLPSGLQYKVLTAGVGAKPKVTDRVKVHYTGSLIDGTVFDSSEQRGEPITFSLNGVIKGWTEILQLMPVGSKWTVYIPAELGYGEHGQGSIPGNSTLIFDIELLEIVK